MKPSIPWRILVTDRNPRVRRLLCRELESEGFRVLSASGWGEIARAVSNGVDCVVMDLNLPSQAGQDGAALLEQLKRNAPYLPVVVHAFSSEEALEAGTLRLASAVVEKSGNTEDLKAAVRRVLAHGSGGRKA
ncbi:response regulator [Desulfocurvibacter africanus]|uniref:Response regulator receiver protein n=1 Tax=Desulfocurvibacter africanus subsp. africanus str. Walvis Bay TaxID=690850 RepID=F3Z479_DESAF|nr:response regulator [Desulfocurvibacter africanus]EGJ51621.1 response regulator receiver protein [Desulfocurvibacter africanus subsp. africanus str. Walvis Bay]